MGWNSLCNSHRNISASVLIQGSKAVCIIRQRSPVKTDCRFPKNCKIQRQSAINFINLFRLSVRNRTIIFSIHQPRYAIFKVFDRLTLLAAGRTVFHGPATEALGYFKSIGKYERISWIRTFHPVSALDCGSGRSGFGLALHVIEQDNINDISFFQAIGSTQSFMPVFRTIAQPCYCAASVYGLCS